MRQATVYERMRQKWQDLDQKRTEAVIKIYTLEAQLAGKWISVEDRLPEVGTPVLTAGLLNARASAYEWFMRSDELIPFCGPFTGLWFRGDLGKHSGHPQITHWQPLPTPPQPGVSTGDAGTDKSA